MLLNCISVNNPTCFLQIVSALQIEVEIEGNYNTHGTFSLIQVLHMAYQLGGLLQYTYFRCPVAGSFLIHRMVLLCQLDGM